MSDSSDRRLYIVYLKNSASQEFADRLKSSYGSFFELSDRAFLLKTADLTSAIAEKLQIRGGKLAAGVVFRLNGSYSGYFRSELWDWLE